MAELFTQGEVLLASITNVSNEEPPPPDNFKCAICLNILNNPVVLSCAHRFCWGCLSRAAASSTVNVSSCPVCRKKQNLDPSNYHVDGTLQRFIKRYFGVGDSRPTMDGGDDNDDSDEDIVKETITKSPNLTSTQSSQQHPQMPQLSSLDHSRIMSFPASSTSIKVVLVAGPRIGLIDGTTVDSFRRDALKSFIEEVILNHCDAECIVMLGDLTAGGRVREYCELRDMILSVSVPFLLLGGDCDYVTNFLAVFPNGLDHKGRLDTPCCRYVFLYFSVYDIYGHIFIFNIEYRYFF